MKAWIALLDFYLFFLKKKKKKSRGMGAFRTTYIYIKRCWGGFFFVNFFYLTVENSLSYKRTAFN